ncbi:MAG: hypothetical protein ACHP9Y_00805 [Gammaproteobacteria bacterium]
MKKRNYYNWVPNQLAEHYTPEELLTWINELRQKYHNYYSRNGYYPLRIMKKIEALVISKIFADAIKVKERRAQELKSIKKRSDFKDRLEYNWNSEQLALHYSLKELLGWKAEIESNIADDINKWGYSEYLNYWQLSCLLVAIKLKINP